MNDTLQAEGADGALDTEESGVAGLVTAWQLTQDDPKAKSDYQILSPYPGLRSFDPAESLIYFGRKGEDEALAKRLESFNVVGVLGGSGSGKSSLVLAGLLPYLKRFQRIPERGGRWYLVQMRPGQDPVKALIAAVWKFVCAPLVDQQFGKRALAEIFEISAQEDLGEASRAALTTLLASDAGGLNHDNLMLFANEHLQKLDAIASGGLQVGPANLLIVIDQFEEIFRDKVEPAGPTAIAELIKKVHQTPRQGLFITLTMRSEEMHRCAEYEGLSEIIFASSVQIELLRKTEDLRAAIIEPARRAFDSWGIPYNRSADSTAPFAPDLIDFLITETQVLSTTLSHKPDSLPLLQHALRAIWNRALSRWQQQLKAKLAAEWVPELTKDDFPWHDRYSPLRACLDESADATRDKALADVIARLGGSGASTMTAAAYLIDMAFASLARMDDNNRWVRSFASAAQIADASIIEVAEDEDKAGSGWHLPGFRASKRRFKVILQGRDEKEKVIAAALNPFVRAGYLFNNASVYDVSHEALIRSWKYYQDLLKQARLTREALYKADAVLTQRAAQAKASWIKRIHRGKSQQAWEALFGINLPDLAKLFVPPRWLGGHWAQTQLDAVAQNLPEPPDLPSSARLSRIESAFKLAKRWTDWDGYKPPVKSWRFLTSGVALILMLAIFALPVLIRESETQVRNMLFYSTGLSDEVMRNDPIAARNQLSLALTSGREIIERSWIFEIPTYLFGSKPVEEMAFQILDQKARAVFRYMPGRVTEGSIPESELSPVKCTKIDESPSEIMKISGLPLKYYPLLNGYSFPPPSRGFPQSMFFDRGDIICASESDGGLLMRIQPSSVVIYPLTAITKSNQVRSIQIGAPTSVAFYDSLRHDKDDNFKQTITDRIANASSGGIRYFKGRADPYKDVQAFVIPYDERSSIFIVNVAGTSYQPYTVESLNCPDYFGEACAPSALRSPFAPKKVEIDEEQYTLEVLVAKSDKETCDSGYESCPQQLVLRLAGPLAQVGATLANNTPTGTQSAPAGQQTTRMDFIYVGLPIVNAIGDGHGHIILLDKAGNALQFAVGTDAFSDSLARAEQFISRKPASTD